MRNLYAHISPEKQRAVFVPYPKWGQRGVFDGDSVRIESDGHEVMAERSDPRSAFHGFRHQLWWDKLDMIYFCGYALWNYLTLPFLLAEPGFELHAEAGVSRAGGSSPRLTDARSLLASLYGFSHTGAHPAPCCSTRPSSTLDSRPRDGC